jgi:hypothetical protein
LYETSELKSSAKAVEPLGQAQWRASFSGDVLKSVKKIDTSRIVLV